MIRILESKKGFELSFAMMFSIIAGAVIIFLAIYATTRFINTSQYSSSSQSAQDLANYLNPIVNGITSATKAPEINFQKETRIYLGCDTKFSSSPVFGRQTLAFSEQSGFLSGWSYPGANISRNNKYIFGENLEQGKILYVFSKPFYLGYMVDDLVFLSFDDYCFVTAPEFIRQEVTEIGIKNINLTDKVLDCKKNSVKVCFGFETSGCNITVSSDDSYETGTILKSGKTISYAGSLIYAGIFSSPSIYECNIKRLGVKTSELAQIYLEKILTVKQKDCNSQIESNLDAIISLSGNLTSNKLKNLYEEAKIMDDKNQKADCQIYSGQDY